MSNGGIKNLMIAKHGKKCWLHYKVTRDNPLTFHHVQPKRENGRATEENGALLSKYAHEDFNRLEQLYPDLAKEVNEYLLIYKGNYTPEIEDRLGRLLDLVREKGKVKKK